MELVTDKDESERFDREMPLPVPVFDIVLDDGSLIRSVAVVGGRALGIIVGGHTGFLPFAAVPQITSRRVRDALRLTRIHRLPFIGPRLRSHWAERVGASSEQPPWVPKI